MHKYLAKFTDENFKTIADLAKEKGCSMNAIINQCIAELTDKKEDKTTLQVMKVSLRESERKLNVLYSAMNNFFLNFAANMDGYIPPETTLHHWLEQAAKDEESRLQMKATKKKWTGDNP